MPMGEYSDFADCIRKNKSKDSPDAYCGYIKNQIEGGKKKEEVMDFPEHELFHLEEAERSLNSGPSGRKLPYPCQYCTQQYPSYYALSEHMGIDHPDKFQHQEETLKTEQDSLTSDLVCAFCGAKAYDPLSKEPCDKCGKGPQYTDAPHLKEADHSGQRQSRLPIGVQHTIKRMGGPEDWTPESEIEKATGEFLNTLKATIDEVTLIAKDTGYMGVSEKVSPTASTYSFSVSGELVDTVVHNVKGFDVQTNFFNQTMAELKDIVKDADKFFVDAGWNSKETVKEYAKHMKHNGKDWD